MSILQFAGNDSRGYKNEEDKLHGSAQSMRKSEVKTSIADIFSGRKVLAFLLVASLSLEIGNIKMVGNPTDLARHSIPFFRLLIVTPEIVNFCSWI